MDAVTFDAFEKVNCYTYVTSLKKSPEDIKLNFHHRNGKYGCHHGFLAAQTKP